MSATRPGPPSTSTKSKRARSSANRLLASLVPRSSVGFCGTMIWGEQDEAGLTGFLERVGEGRLTSEDVGQPHAVAPSQESVEGGIAEVARDGHHPLAPLGQHHGEVARDSGLSFTLAGSRYRDDLFQGALTGEVEEAGACSAIRLRRGTLRGLPGHQSRRRSALERIETAGTVAKTGASKESFQVPGSGDGIDESLSQEGEADPEREPQRRSEDAHQQVVLVRGPGGSSAERAKTAASGEAVGKEHAGVRGHDQAALRIDLCPDGGARCLLVGIELIESLAQPLEWSLASWILSCSSRPALRRELSRCPPGLGHRRQRTRSRSGGHLRAGPGCRRSGGTSCWPAR